MGMASPDISRDSGEGVRVLEVSNLRPGQRVRLEHINPVTGKTSGAPIEGSISGARHGSSPVCEGEFFSVPKRGPVPFRARSNVIYQITENTYHIHADVCVFLLTILEGETGNNPTLKIAQPEEELVSIPINIGNERSKLRKLFDHWFPRKPAVVPPNHGLSIFRHNSSKHS